MKIMPMERSISLPSCLPLISRTCIDIDLLTEDVNSLQILNATSVEKEKDEKSSTSVDDASVSSSVTKSVKFSPTVEIADVSYQERTSPDSATDVVCRKRSVSLPLADCPQLPKKMDIKMVRMRLFRLKRKLGLCKKNLKAAMEPGSNKTAFDRQICNRRLARCQRRIDIVTRRLNKMERLSRVH